MKYSDFKLPSSVNRESGSHISWYCHFNAFSEYNRIKIKCNLSRKKLVSCVRRSEKLNHHHLTQLAASWKNFLFFVARKTK